MHRRGGVKRQSQGGAKQHHGELRWNLALSTHSAPPIPEALFLYSPEGNPVSKIEHRSLKPKEIAAIKHDNRPNYVIAYAYALTSTRVAATSKSERKSMKKICSSSRPWRRTRCEPPS